MRAGHQRGRRDPPVAAQLRRAPRRRAANLVRQSAAHQAGNTLVLVTWDEGNETSTTGIDCAIQANIDASGCHIGLVAASAYITPGIVDATSYTPYSTLAAIETMNGLPLLGRAATATPLGPGMGF